MPKRVNPRKVHASILSGLAFQRNSACDIPSTRSPTFISFLLSGSLCCLCMLYRPNADLPSKVIPAWRQNIFVLYSDFHSCTEYVYGVYIYVTEEIDRDGIR